MSEPISVVNQELFNLCLMKDDRIADLERRILELEAEVSNLENGAGCMAYVRDKQEKRIAEMAELLDKLPEDHPSRMAWERMKAKDLERREALR